MCRLVLTLIAGCGIAASFAVPASAAQRPTAATARLDAKGLALVDTYLQRSRGANTRAETLGANATAKRIFKHVRGASARYDRRSIDTVATYVVRAGMPELQANLGANLTVYNDALGFVTKSNLFELMRLSPDVLHRIRDGGTTIHIGDRPITTMAGIGRARRHGRPRPRGGRALGGHRRRLQPHRQRRRGRSRQHQL